MSDSMRCQRGRICAEDANKRYPIDPAHIGKELWVMVDRPHWEVVIDHEGKKVEEMIYLSPYYFSVGFGPEVAIYAGVVELLARGPEDFCEFTELMPAEPWMLVKKEER